MNFENTKVMNFEGALRGMRNPKESWNKSDSVYGLLSSEEYKNIIEAMLNEYKNKDMEFPKETNGILKYYDNKGMKEIALIGPNDMKLAQTLIRSGSEHRKFLRQIFVCVDITAPIYWWKEFDTYKVATVANSTSTMHKLATTPITMNCFENRDYNLDLVQYPFIFETTKAIIDPIVVIDFLEQLRLKYLETKDKRYWKELIRWLPESWLQKRTVTMNYENLLGMCSPGQRRFHKLTEWSKDFILWARSLPYAQEFIFIDELGEK